MSLVTFIINGLILLFIVFAPGRGGFFSNSFPINLFTLLVLTPLTTTIFITGFVAYLTHIPIFKSFILGFLSSFMAFGLTTVLLFGWIRLGYFCGDRLMLFHDFNAHLKDVCMRDGARECPRDEGALKAFDPGEYRELQKCYKTKYWFDPKTGEYAWVIREVGKHFIFMSHPQLHEGFSQFFDSFTAQGTNASASALPAGDIPWSSLYP